GTQAVVPGVARYTVLADDGMPGAIAGAVCGKADLLVVDHYRLDEGYERAARAHARHVLVLDDLADRRHDCDILLDQTCGRSAADYRPLVPAHCRLLTGSRFSLLRPAFRSSRAASLARRREGVSRVVVSLGGTDPDNVTPRILDALADLPLAIDVVMGGGAPHLEAVRAAVARLPSARLHVNVADMATLLAQADLAIGAAGTSAWERCCLGLPTIVVVLADNQRLIARNLAEAGAALVVSPEPSELRAALRQLQAPGALARMSEAAAAVCDGDGVARLCDTIDDLLASED
ncbi:MAG TPA: UDP-2,4-diacetamido-2,4,6-trideoxy-beta-L-altropyranose hydrolase, partial [Magnetospirillum sp.]|nr:UDP-2,4-diacetamido-2,4,6-trideoxy-beta-L-altropyranose hydrolase [Magnetospirillum sp.]